MKILWSTPIHCNSEILKPLYSSNPPRHPVFGGDGDTKRWKLGFWTTGPFKLGTWTLCAYSPSCVEECAKSSVGQEMRARGLTGYSYCAKGSPMISKDSKVFPPGPVHFCKSSGGYVQQRHTKHNINQYFQNIDSIGDLYHLIITLWGLTEV